MWTTCYCFPGVFLTSLCVLNFFCETLCVWKRTLSSSSCVPVWNRSSKLKPGLQPVLPMMSHPDVTSCCYSSRLWIWWGLHHFADATGLIVLAADPSLLGPEGQTQPALPNSSGDWQLSSASVLQGFSPEMISWLLKAIHSTVRNELYEMYWRTQCNNTKCTVIVQLASLLADIIRRGYGILRIMNWKPLIIAKHAVWK